MQYFTYKNIDISLNYFIPNHVYHKDFMGEPDQ